MDHGHDHSSPTRAHAARPTISLLRMSAVERLGLVAAAVGLLWAATALVLT